MKKAFRKILAKVLPRPCKIWLDTLLRSRAFPLPPGSRLFVFLSADYGNIGDIAISRAQQAFVSSVAGARTIVPIPISQTRYVLQSIRVQMNDDDLVTVIGGGNMGFLYPDIEDLRQLVIRSFPNNRIVCFPQTLDWNESRQSRHALDRIVRVYSQHPDLYLHAREAVSYEKLKELFADQSAVRIGFVPDIVLSATAAELGADGDDSPRGALLCLRDDRERLLDDSHRQVLSQALIDAGLDSEVTDTHVGGSSLLPERCAQLLAEKLMQFQAARLVVTDRLHGMILAALAGTPCLVLPNSNHKIRQTWKDWLADVQQVRFLALEELGEREGIDEAVRQLLATPRRDPAEPVINRAHYEDLRRAIARL
ncbi:polysaccharide pyruvyl transferase family protein [Halomonas smyrnensis]|uniref:polysaccharide pyruvyl transferase family protein n=1 Tax=Halomonas smyrnensis TaxID=720605 RepID=UPI000A009C0E|nr:polysaccharide pyruvyl transferase family protein [Halomonas smyrnensis]